MAYLEWKCTDHCTLDSVRDHLRKGRMGPGVFQSSCPLVEAGIDTQGTVDDAVASLPIPPHELEYATVNDRTTHLS